MSLRLSHPGEHTGGVTDEGQADDETRGPYGPRRFTTAGVGSEPGSRTDSAGDGDGRTTGGDDVRTTEDGTSVDATDGGPQPTAAEAGIDESALGDHQTYVPGRGIYDERNRLNDLTGREWKFASKSVIAKGYPPAVQHDLRSEHGGQKPPRLCGELIDRFSKAGDTVLDPYAGVGGTLLGASFCEHLGTGLREAIGFERTPRWVAIYEEVLDRENDERRERGQPPLSSQDMRQGDCLDLVESIPDSSVELVLTDVPYWHMDRLEQTRNRERTRPSKLDAFDGEDGESAPAWETKSDWLSEMARHFERFTRTLVDRGYVLIFIGDMYRDSAYEPLSADLARAIDDRVPSLTLKASLVWYDPTKDLHVYGYPFAFVPSMVHQHILVFRKEQ